MEDAQSKQVTERPILVTGGAGFVGSHLVRRLLRDGHGVAVLTKSGTDMKRIADLVPQLTVLYDDLSNQASLAEKLQTLQPRGIFHLAGIKTRAGIGGPDDDVIATNILGTMHLVKALEGMDYKFFIHSGTSFEYGAHDEPLAEDNLCEPVGTYGVSKLAATLYCQATARNTGKPIVTFRAFSLYGPDMDPGQLFYEVVGRALRNETITLTKPETNRDFIFIEDLIDLYCTAMEQAPSFAGQIFNAGSGVSTTLEDLAKHVIALTDSKSTVLWDASKSSVYDRGCQKADTKKTFEAFPWRPAHDLDSGMRKVMAWFTARENK